MKRQDIVNTMLGLEGESGHKRVISVYNSQNPLPQGYKLKSSDAWCAATVTAVFLINGGCDFAECSCPRMITKAKALGIWQESDAYKPQIGDVCFYDWQDTGAGDNVGTPDHVGIVIRSDDSGFVVREGNKNKSIGNRSMALNARYIRGFITPKFDEISDDSPKPINNTPSAEKSNSASNSYKIGRTYTVKVKTSLNVRIGAGTNYRTVGYWGLTSDGRKHATAQGALKNGTKVTILEIKVTQNEIWCRIPSGWICAKSGSNIYLV